jgi:peptidoglycan/xylan/chitin deacetylase (PgdA/CDA1 family)
MMTETLGRAMVASFSGPDGTNQVIQDLAKRLLYASGALGMFHRLRNRNALTVVMYHRVLDPADPRWASCDPDYTVSVAFFEKTLRFFRRHYHFVSLDQVIAARRGQGRLPPRPLLVTFDDGWCDNVDYAMPVLTRERVPAVVFTVADAVGRDEPFFQEQLIAAVRSRRMPAAELHALAKECGVETAADDLATLRGVIAALEKMAPVERERTLAPFSARLVDGQRHMVSVGDLARLRAESVAIGLHGKTHTPMTRAEDLDAELDLARRQLAGALGVAPALLTTLSFPHGRYTPAIVDRARSLGYELMFTSVPSLNAAAPRCPDLLARVGVETESGEEPSGRFRPDWLALRLFRSPLARLA